MTVQVMPLEQYALLVGKSSRTIYRHIEAGVIPGAFNDGSGWFIPVDDELVAPAPARTTMPRTPQARARDNVTDVDTVSERRTVPQALGFVPILMTLEQAGMVLDASPAQVDAMRRRGVLDGVKRGRSWTITRASIMRLAGETRS